MARKSKKTEEILKPLSAQQTRFCEEFMVDLNQTAAVVRAGYSIRGAATRGHDLMQLPQVKAYIKCLQDAVKERLNITQDRVISDIIEIKDRCMQNVPVMRYDKVEKEYVQEEEYAINENGDEVLQGVYRFDAANALHACDMLGKHLGLYEKDNKSKAAKLALSIDRDKMRAMLMEDDELIG